MSYITGQTIRTLRERKQLTQRELADRLSVSDKTISKWETDRGLPDISILGELASALSVSLPELMTGEIAENRNRAANIRRGKFHVCPICGNVIYALGAGAYSCCGILLPALEAEAADDAHTATLQNIDGDLYVHIDHPMEKTHYLSFIACLTDGDMQLHKLYPEQEAEATFRRCGMAKLYVYCNRHGLTELTVPRKL